MTYRYREFFIFLVVSEKIGTGKSLGTGIGKIWYRKKVSEPVSEKFGTEKSTGARVEARVVDEAGGGDETRVDAVERKLKEQFRAAHGHI